MEGIVNIAGCSIVHFDTSSKLSLEDIKSNDIVLMTSHHQSNKIAVGINNFLIILERDVDERVEMDFDSAIVAITWDHSGEFLVVGDRDGNLHVLTSAGTLIFSHTITNGSL